MTDPLMDLLATEAVVILEWASTFTAYMSVIVSKHPNRAAESLEYLSLIRYVAFNAAFTTDTKDTKCCGWRTGQHPGTRSALLEGSNKVQECEILVCSRGKQNTRSTCNAS